ncbi:MAG: sulfatase/phosphatase domain-containing protein, partial [Planctomycetaceae bacterium]
MIVVAPGVTSPGSQVTQPVSLIDLYPTLMALTSTEAPEHLQGQSLVAELREPRTASNRKVLITRRPKQRVLEDSRWRFIHYRPGVEELYDIRNDPNELVNLANDPKYNRIRRNFRRKLPRRLVDIVK